MIALAILLAGPLDGVWSLERIDAVMVADGRVVANEAVDDAPHATGLIVYDPSGWMSLQIGAGGRATDRTGPVGRSRPIATGGYYAYYGRYSVDPAAATVRHAIADSLMPPEIGIAVVRHYKIEGDRLTLVSDPVARPGGARINRAVWRRLSADTSPNPETGRH